MISQVGNYDYAIDWIFTQHGAIRIEVALTGIDAPKAVLSTTIQDPTGPVDTRTGHSSRRTSWRPAIATTSASAST